jgi:archaetidylinositol phosphate synthase
MRGAVIPLGRLGVTPNMLTVLGVIISLSTAYLFTLSSKNKEFLIYCGSLILLSGFVDAIDGILARSINRVTRFGGYFDSVADR